MDYAAKKEELIEQHNKLTQQADQLIEQVKQYRNGAVAIRGQLQLIEEIDKETEGGEGCDDAS